MMDAFDSPLTPMATLRWNMVRSILVDLRPASVMEIGCGQGSFGARIASFSTYVGVELDPRSYSVAKPRIEAHGGRAINGTWDAVGGESLSDVVCAFEVLEHLLDDVGALTQWRSLVRPGGSLVLSVPAWPDRYGPMDRLVGHYRRYAPPTLSTALVSAGFEAAHTVLYGWPLGFVLEATRNRIAKHRGDPPDESTTAETSMAERSAGSGRLFQPRALAGAAVAVGVAPFSMAQRLRKDQGTGLIATARRPLVD